MCQNPLNAQCELIVVLNKSTISWRIPAKDLDQERAWGENFLVWEADLGTGEILAQTVCRGFSSGCSFFAYGWKLPAYSGAFCHLQLTILALFIDSWSFFTYNFRVFYLQWELFGLQWESASNKRLKGLQAEKLNCKQKSSNCK